MSRARDFADLAGSADAGGLTGRNLIINGAAVLDQRNGGSSVTAGTGTYTLDRWRAYNNTDGVFTVQQVSDSPDEFSYSIKATATTADSSLAAGQQAKLQQRIEGYNVAPLALGSSGAKSFTLSFYVKSSVTGTFGVGLINSANDRSFVTSYTINSADTWEYKTITLAGDTSGTWLTTNGIGLNIQWSLGMGSNLEGTSGSWQAGEKSDASGFTKLIGTLNATWQITGVQLEVGEQATPFDHSESYGETLAKCQRYFQILKGSWFVALGTTQIRGMLEPINAPMRGAPTIGTQGGDINVGDMVGYGNNSGTAPTQSSYVSSEYGQGVGVAGFASLTQYRVYRHEPNSTHAGLFTMDAEL